MKEDENRYATLVFSINGLLNERFCLLEVGVVRSTGEGDDVTNVGHTGHEEQQTLEAEAEA